MEFTLTHTCIRVMNLEKSIKFYEDALGLKISRRSDFETFSLVFLSDKNNQYFIELTYNVGQEVPYEIGNGYSHIAFYVTDIEKAHAHHKSLGYETTDLKRISDKSSRIYFVTDPDGYKVELIENNNL